MADEDMAADIATDLICFGFSVSKVTTDGDRVEATRVDPVDFKGGPDMILASQDAWNMYVKHMEGLKTRDHVTWIKWRFRG